MVRWGGVIAPEAVKARTAARAARACGRAVARLWAGIGWSSCSPWCLPARAG